MTEKTDTLIHSIFLCEASASFTSLDRAPHRTGKNTMACTCGTSTAEVSDFNDYALKYELKTQGTGDTESETSDDSVVLNVAYRRVTPLFRAIERENWEGVLSFLSTGRWSSSIFSSMSQNMRAPAQQIQAKTWVTCYQKGGVVEWSQLPLHAAISYNAPFVVIQKLVELYPKAIQCTDNEGMLPIHLAFGFGCQDQILALLMEPFPASVNERGLGGRFPYQCCELGPNKTRGKVYKIISEQIVKRTRHEIDHDWKEFCRVAQRSINLEPQEDDFSHMKLTEFLLELLKDRKELYEMKKAYFRQKGVSPTSTQAAKQRSSRRTPSEAKHNGETLTSSQAVVQKKNKVSKSPRHAK